MISSKRESTSANYGSFGEFSRDLPSALSRAIACLQVKPSVKPSSLLESLWSYVSPSPPQDLWPYGLEENFLENLLQRVGLQTRQLDYKNPNQRDILLLDLTARARQSSRVYILDGLKISPPPATQESKELIIRVMPEIAPISNLRLAAKSYASDEDYRQLEFDLNFYHDFLSLQSRLGHHVWPYGIHEVSLKIFLKNLNDLTDLLNSHYFFLDRIEQKSFLTTSPTNAQLIVELKRMARGLEWFFKSQPWLKCNDIKDELQTKISSVKTLGAKL